MKLIPALIAAMFVTACATNPVTGKRELSFMSEAQEISVGRELDAQVRQEMGLYDNDGLQRYVQDLGMGLARSSERPNLPWSFAVLDSPAVNAFALPGGFIYITRGILPYLDNEAQLVGVLGHEIGHVTARRSACSSAASSCPRFARSAISPKGASACCSSSSAATTRFRRMRWGPSTR